MKKKNPQYTDENVDFTIEIDESADPSKLPPWYVQMIELEDDVRSVMQARALSWIKETKPKAHDFIKKFDCEFVGFIPQISYTLPTSDEGESDVTWIHSFSIPTLLFWCRDGGFGFFINANLDYDDTVLNKIKGNIKQKLRGFTG